MAHSQRLNRAVRLVGFIYTVSFLTSAVAQPVSGQDRPNLVFVMTDDQALWTIGAYGNKVCPTPNLDRLAAEGALFTNAFSVTPLCSPSRASFLTGLYPTQAGISDVLYWTLMERMLPPEEYRREIQRGLDAATVTWPEVLQQNGYVTGLVGKWHLGVQDEHHPTRHGFDYYCGPSLAGVLNLMKYKLEENGQDTQYDRFLTDVLTDKAIDFIEGNRQRPFALVLCPQVPHSPWNKVPPEDLAPLQNVDIPLPDPAGDFGTGTDRLREMMRNYLGLVRTVDRNVGRILTTLDHAELRDRTVVVFTSDHGFMMGHRNLIGKGTATFYAGGVFGPRRMNMFDDSLRVPLLIRWPGVIQAGTRFPQVISNLDFFPTILTMLGVDRPETPELEGRDITPLLGGRDMDLNEPLFGQLDVERNGFSLMRMIRTNRWKLVRHHLPLMTDELYDLENDPAETRNLYRTTEHRSTRDQLQQQLTAWQKSIDDPVFNVEHAIHNK